MPEAEDQGRPTTPSVTLEPHTLVFDRLRQRPVLRLHGIVVLPVGSEIELLDPHVSATVEQVRLLAGSDRSVAAVCLDVSVPAEYWDEPEDPMGVWTS